MIKLEEGLRAPWFQGVDQSGNEVKLSDFAGKKLVLFFYPRDNTPGCTAEACNLRDNIDKLKSEGFSVIGISSDSEKSHKRFSGKYSLPYPLIADTSKKILTNYGVWGEKKMLGKTYMGIYRTTFIIDGNGIIDKIITKVKTADHSEQIFKTYNNK